MGCLNIFIVLLNLLSEQDWLDPIGSLTYPLMMLGLRASPKDDFGFYSAEAVYGTALSLPGKFLKHSEIPPEIFLP